MHKTQIVRLDILSGVCDKRKHECVWKTLATVTRTRPLFGDTIHLSYPRSLANIKRAYPYRIAPDNLDEAVFAREVQGTRVEVAPSIHVSAATNQLVHKVVVPTVAREMEAGKVVAVRLIGVPSPVEVKPADVPCIRTKRGYIL